MPPMPPSTMAPMTTHKTKVTPTAGALELPLSLPASQIRTPTASSAPITIRNVPTSEPTPSPSRPINGAEWSGSMCAGQNTTVVGVVHIVCKFMFLVPFNFSEHYEKMHLVLVGKVLVSFLRIPAPQ